MKVQELGLDIEDDDQVSGELFIGELSVDTCYKSPWIETLQIQDVPVKFKLDSGCETHVLHYNIYQKLSNVKL